MVDSCLDDTSVNSVTRDVKTPELYFLKKTYFISWVRNMLDIFTYNFYTGKNSKTLNINNFN